MDHLAGPALGAHRIHLQWVPSHCDLERNERADTLAKETPQLPQDEAALDIRVVHRAAARTRARATASWPQGWYRPLMGARATAIGRPEPCGGRGRTP